MGTASVAQLCLQKNDVTSTHNWNMSFNPDKSCTLINSLQKDRLVTLLPHPSNFLTILLRKFSYSISEVSLSAMVFVGKTTFQSWPPKPAADWSSSVVQSPSSAHLNYPLTRPSSTVRWIIALSSGLASLPSHLAQLEAMEAKVFKII